jgi:hypothetical protein
MGADYRILGNGPMGEMFNFRVNTCPFTNHSLRRLVMLRGAARVLLAQAR